MTDPIRTQPEPAGLSDEKIEAIFDKHGQYVYDSEEDMGAKVIFWGDFKTAAREIESASPVAAPHQPVPVSLSDEPGMIPMEYADVDSGARIVCEPSEDRPSTGCWVVLNSHHISPSKEFSTAEAAYHALRAAIAADRAQRQPVPPEPGEVQELVEWLRELGAKRGGVFDVSTFCANLTRAADLLAQRYPQPVPVSERLPGPGDCDEEGMCWWWCSPAERWLRIGIPQPDQASQVHTHWLPAHALPLPGEVEG